MILPTLDDVKEAVVIAKSWLKDSEAFLGSSSCMESGSCSMLKLEVLKVCCLLKLNIEVESTIIT